MVELVFLLGHFGIANVRGSRFATPLHPNGAFLTLGCTFGSVKYECHIPNDSPKSINLTYKLLKKDTSN